MNTNPEPQQDIPESCVKAAISEIKANLRPSPKTGKFIHELLKSEVYRALTVQALRMRREVWWLGGMDQKHFTQTYLNNLGAYERRIAKEEGIEL